MTSNTARDALDTRLRDLLGENDAATMMQLLPPGDPEQMATKTDIAHLDLRMDNLDLRMGRLDGRMGRLDGRMDRLEERMDRLERSMDKFDDRLQDFHAALREQTRNFIRASTASIATVAGLAFAAATFV